MGKYSEICKSTYSKGRQKRNGHAYNYDTGKVYLLFQAVVENGWTYEQAMTLRRSMYNFLVFHFFDFGHHLLRQKERNKLASTFRRLFVQHSRRDPRSKNLGHSTPQTRGSKLFQEGTSQIEPAWLRRDCKNLQDEA